MFAHFGILGLNVIFIDDKLLKDNCWVTRIIEGEN